MSLRLPLAALPSLLLTLALIAPAAAPGGKKKPRATEELTNFLLSPRYSIWLVGPIAQIAEPEEISAYLELTDDEAAEAFIRHFWDRRGAGDSPWPEDRPRLVFERRALEADNMFSEGATRGRSTDRGTTYVLYGPPAETGYATPTDPRRPSVEVWVYGKDAAPGLDGKAPHATYYFIKQGNRTVFHNPRLRRPIIR